MISLCFYSQILHFPFTMTIFFLCRRRDTMFKRSRNREKESILLYNGEIKREFPFYYDHIGEMVREMVREMSFFYQVITCDENLWIECFDGVDPFDLAFMVDVVSNPWMISPQLWSPNPRNITDHHSNFISRIKSR